MHEYKLIADLEEVCEEIYCYMPDELYLKLKQIHHDLNTNSKAQIMRKIIEVFFDVMQEIRGLGIN
jgi:hypothetical protein